jgi:hypothetical protein
MYWMMPPSFHNLEPKKAQRIFCLFSQAIASLVYVCLEFVEALVFLFCLFLQVSASFGTSFIENQFRRSVLWSNSGPWNFPVILVYLLFSGLGSCYVVCDLQALIFILISFCFTHYCVVFQKFGLN